MEVYQQTHVYMHVGEHITEGMCMLCVQVSAHEGACLPLVQARQVGM